MVQYKTFCFSDLIGPLIVEFVSDQFEHVESSTQFFISLSLERGTAAFDIMVIVLPFDQSPVSAEGEWRISLIMLTDKTFDQGMELIMILLQLMLHSELELPAV